MILDKVQDSVVEVGVAAEGDPPVGIVVAIQVTWLALIIVVVVGDGEVIAAEDNVTGGHIEDDGSDGEGKCYRCAYFNLCFLL